MVSEQVIIMNFPLLDPDCLWNIYVFDHYVCCWQKKSNAYFMQSVFVRSTVFSIQQNATNVKMVLDDGSQSPEEG